METQILNTSIIPIEYTKGYETRAIKLKKYIENNSLLFEIFLGGYEKITFNNDDDIKAFHISSLKKLKKQMKLSSPEWTEVIKDILIEEENLDIQLLKHLLLQKVDELDNSTFDSKRSSNIDSSINSIYSLIGALYYDELNQPQGLVNFLFAPTEKEKEKILSWLKDKSRFDLLNSLLKTQYKILIKTDDEENEHDPFLKNYMKEFNKILKSYFMNKMDLLAEEDKNIQVPKLNSLELDQLCIEFLSYIDPSLRWLTEYNNFKKEGRIIFDKTLSDDNLEWGCVRCDNKILILAPLENTIRDFIYLIHEFSHGISLDSIEEIEEYLPIAIKEFPAIFFEMCATEFLKEKGYSQEIIDFLFKERNTVIKENMKTVTPTLDYLYQTLAEGPITYESEMKNLRTSTGCLGKRPKENKRISKLYDSVIKNRIDRANLTLLLYPKCTLGEYPYVMGKYLANKAFAKKEEDPSIIPTVIEITENLANETVISIIQKLGISADEFSDKKESIQYVKKQN